MNKDLNSYSNFCLTNLIRNWVQVGSQVGISLDENFDQSSKKIEDIFKSLNIFRESLDNRSTKNLSIIDNGCFVLPDDLATIDQLLLKNNLNWLQKKFQLSNLEILVLTLIYCSQRVQILQSFLSEFSSLNYYKLILLISKLVSSDEITIRKILDHDSRLERLGLLKSKLYEEGEFHTRFVILDAIADYLVTDRISLGHFQEDMVRSSFSEMKIEEFPHLHEEVENIGTFLSQVCEKKVDGINILIHGPEASGKTQFIRSLADNLNLQLYETSTAPIQRISLEGRLQSILRAQCLLHDEKNALLLVDDFQNLLDLDSSDPFLGGLNPYAKRFINTYLGKNLLPTVWVTNRLDIFSFRDMSRFSFCLEFKKPTRLMRQDFLRKKLNGLAISESWIIKTAMKEFVPFQTLEKISQFTKLICQCSKATDAEVVFDRALRKSTQYLSSNQSFLSGFNAENYSSELINADTDLHEVCEALKNHSEARLCLAGPPGCGKTAYAYYLSYLLEKPIISKKASDVLGRYLGDTEQNLANSFLEAKNSDAILLLDEVDGLLTNRRDAVRSWEISMVNELLTQIDTFKGLLIVTTNLFEKIDTAAMRRFDLKVTFDYLNSDQISKLWDSYSNRFGLVFDEEICSSAIKIKGLTPGDFMNVERQSKFLPIKDSADFFNRLKKEVSFKKDNIETNRIGFLSVTSSNT